MTKEVPVVEAKEAKRAYNEEKTWLRFKKTSMTKNLKKLERNVQFRRS